MRQNTCLSIYIPILYLIVCKALPASETKIEEKLDVIEYLVHGEMHFVRKDIQTDKEERKEFMRKLNETLDTLIDNIVVNKVTGTHGQAENAVDMNDRDELIVKV